MSQKYAINEVFESIQGEGTFTGMGAIFIRLQGCDVGCPWCDTQQTWLQKADMELSLAELPVPSNNSEHWAWASANELLGLIKNRGYCAKLIVITGGEPASVDLRPLSDLFIDNAYQVQLETSGTYPVLINDKAWVTVSPKVAMKAKMPVLQQALERADEIKHPVAMERDIDNLKDLLKMLPADHHKQICLQPISCQKRATQLAIKHCLKEGWRLSVQLHKYLDVE